MKKVFTMLSLLMSGMLAAQSDLLQEIYLERNASGLSDVVDIVNAGDNSNRLFFVEQDGDVKVHVVGSSEILNTQFLDLSVSFGAERGLLGLVFHPNYESNGYFFVNYMPSSNLSRISRFRVSGSNANVADAASEVILMEYTQPYGNHNGGALAFDNAGRLYIATGDGGDGGDPEERAQDLTSIHGKILRVNPSLSGAATNFNAHTPSDGNPFALSDMDTVQEIWHVGLRNPWKIHIDDADNLWIADVGERMREEVNYVSNGQPLNFGWDCREGTIEFEATSCVEGVNYTEPVLDYVRSGTDPAGTSITGGVVLPTNRYPNFGGHYLFGDYGNSRVWTLSSVSTAGRSAMSINRVLPGVGSVSTFGLDEDGNAYAASLDGDIFRFADASLPVALITTAIERIDKKVQLTWTTSSEVDASHFEIERRNEAGDFVQIGVLPAKADDQSTSTDYSFQDLDDLVGRYYYRLKAVDLDGTFTYSVILSIEILEDEDLELTPNPAKAFFDLRVPEDVVEGSVILTDIKGQILLEQDLHLDGRRMRISTRDLPSGLLYVTVRSTHFTQTRRLMIAR